jgi:RHS repeat-associated protein
MQGREGAAVRLPWKQTGMVRTGVASAIAALILAAGLTASPEPARAGVDLTHFGIDPSNGAVSVPPEPMAVPPAIPVSLDGTTGTVNPFPSVPEAVEYDHLIRSSKEVGPLDSGLLGESVDYFTGQTDFATTDVSLPGNSALPVAVGRRYHVTNHTGGVLYGLFGDWDLDIPHVEGVVATSVGWTVPGASVDERCTYFGAPPAATVTEGTVTTTVPASEYNLGFTAVIPGEGRHELLLRAANAPEQTSNDRVTTRDLWAVSCAQRSNIPVNGGPDEGFIVTTPNGFKYTFDQGFTRAYAPLERPADTATAGVTATVDRTQIWMMPTKVEDRFGNSVVYTYVNDNFNGIVLKRIAASDGRTLTLNYSGGVVHSVDDGTRTWNYGYSGTQSRLTSVTLPDNSSWSIDFANLNAAAWDYTAPTCTSLPSPSLASAVTGTITHPTGAHGVFTFNVTRHGRHGAPSTCLSNSANVNFAPVEPTVYDVLSLTKKQITGPNILGTQTWTVAYAGCAGNACNSTTTTKVTDARSNNTLMTFGAEYGTSGSGNEGMLLHRQSGGSGTYPKDEVYTYYDAGGHAYPAVLGTPAQVRGDVSQLTSLRPVQSTTLTVDGATYTRTLGSPDMYGFPSSITHAGSATKIDTLVYGHNQNEWVLGTVKSITSGGKVEYDATLSGDSQPTQINRFGRVDRKFGYNGDGTMAWMQDGGGHQTSFNYYSYGIPKTISYPNSTSESVSVNDLGKITSHTDPMGLTTNYGYDSMGRLSAIIPPGGYNATNIGWSTSASGWSRSITTGTATTSDTYDAYLHSVKTTDTAGREIDRTFDADGNMTYESYPTGVNGITSTYDGLNRVATQTDDQNRTITYDPGANALTVTDRNGNQTKYTYLNYDGPGTAWPLSVLPPAGVSAATAIERDVWGKPVSIKRGSIQRTIAYDTGQLLYSITEPETGATIFTRDGAGNIKTVTYADATVETRSYDARNRMTGVTYSDGSPSLTLTWKADGQPDTATRGSTARTWTYNGASGLLTGESVTIDGTAYTLGYDYDTNRHLKTLTYPDASSISLAPDAYGRPAQAGAYATGAHYFENDAMSAFTYGNGIAHSLTQYTNERPKLVKDTNVLSTTTAFDYVGNPTTITDSVDASRSRTLTYDTSDRLKTAQGPWGSGTLTYDVQDNLTADTVTGLSLTINATSNLPTTGTWDTRGRLSQKGSGASLTNYTFDGSNMLRQVAQPGGTWNYAYDALGYRTHTDGNGAITASVYDGGGRLLYEASAQITVADRIFQNGFDPPVAPSTATKYVYLGSHLVAKERTANAVTQVLYQHTDALGTPVAQTDASKNLVGTSTYQPYGGLYAFAGNGNETGPGYANQYGDPTGLIYMRARYYDPSLHRFISSDPNPADPNTARNFNRYAYANNNPYKYFDPSGRDGACFYADCNSTLDLSGVTAFLSSDAFGEIMQSAGMAMVIASQSGGNISEEAVESEVAAQGALNARAQSRAAQLDANRAIGKIGEAITRADLGESIAGEQVTFITSDGTRARTDFVTVDKGVVETKTGNAVLSSGQEKLKADIDAGRQVTPVGRNAEEAGLIPGQPTTMSSCTVDRPEC